MTKKSHRRRFLKAFVSQIARDIQKEEDEKIIAAMEVLIQSQIDEMKRNGYIHVWDEEDTGIMGDDDS